MNFDEILLKIDPTWRDDFRSLVTTGRTSDAFWAVYECRPDYQKLSDAALQYFFEPIAQSIQRHKAKQLQTN
jgi:hypothetical protein